MKEKDEKVEESSVHTACLYGRPDGDDDTFKADSATIKSPRRMRPCLFNRLKLVVCVRQVSMLGNSPA